MKELRRVEQVRAFLGSLWEYVKNLFETIFGCVPWMAMPKLIVKCVGLFIIISCMVVEWIPGEHCNKLEVKGSPKGLKPLCNVCPDICDIEQNNYVRKS